VNKDEILRRLKAIAARVTEVNSMVETRAANPEGDPVDYNALNEELDNLGLEKRQLQLRLRAIEMNEETAPETRSLGGLQNLAGTPEKRFEKMDAEERRGTPEYRNAFLKTLQGKALSDVEKRAYTSASASAGAVIPTETAEKIFDKMTKTAPMLGEITLLRIAGALKFGVENARDAADEHDENDAVSPASDTLAYVTLGSYERIKILRISKTVQTMAISAFENWLTKILAEDIAVKLENDIINGSGSSEPKGIEKARTWTDGTSSIEYAYDGSPTYDEVMDMIALLPARYDRNAKFLTTKKFLFGKLAKIKDDQKQPILIKDMTKDVPLAIMGYPVLISDKVEAGSMYLGDFTNVVGNLSQDITIESSTQSGFLNNAIDYRGTAMFDCSIMLADAFVKMLEADAPSGN
jgi:HK97 family phage major capsid protein